MSAHFYNLNGDLVDPWTPGALPSPSTILDRLRSYEYEALVERAGQEAADDLMEHAAERGTRVHKACELWATGKPVGQLLLTSDEAQYLDGFKRWLDEHKARVLSAETFLWSAKHKFAGTCDLIVVFPGGDVWIIDIKTGQDNVRHGLQLKYYQQAYYEMTGVRARMGVLALDPKRACGFRHSKSPYGLKEYREPLSAIVAHLNVFKWWNKKKPAKAPKQEATWTL